MRALVTGASSGIGRALCEVLLDQGHAVVGLARDFAKFPCAHPRFEPHCIDLGDLDALPGRLRALARQYPRLDALVCNAGQGRFGHLEEFSCAQIRALMDLNFTSHVFAVRAFLPQMKKAGRGHIVFMGSEAALQGRSRGTLYCAGKFALRGFAQALRAECSTAGVRVTIVHPGMVQTPFFAALDFAPGPAPDNYILPEDVARLVVAALAARPGTVVDEISLSPQKRVVDFTRRKED